MIKFQKSLVFFTTSAILMLCYLPTMAMTLQVGDAGEQIAAAHFLGISHPTGTPLYLLVMKLWEIIFPFGTIVWRMNLISCLCSSLAGGAFAVFLFRFSKVIDLPHSVGLIASASLSASFFLSVTMWQESTQASSYSIHILFVALWLNAALSASLSSDQRSIALMYLCAGFALATHILAVVVLLATWLLSFSLLRSRRLQPISLFIAQLGLVPGCLFYLYIPIRALSQPVINWGDPSSLSRLISYLLRKNYQSKVWIQSFGDISDILQHHLIVVGRVVAPLAVLSVIIVVYKRKFLVYRSLSSHAKQWFYFGLAIFFLNLFFVGLHGSHTDIFFWNRYFLTGYLGIYIAGAIILLACLRQLSSSQSAVLLSVLLLYPILFNYERCNRSQNTLLKHFIMQILAQTPHDATLAASGDNSLFGLLYYHNVEKERPDINLVNEELRIGDMAEASSDIASNNYYTTYFNTVPEPYRLVQHGLLFRVVNDASEGFSQEASIRFDLDNIEQLEATSELSPLERALITSQLFHHILWLQKHGTAEEIQEEVTKMMMNSRGFPDSMFLAANVLLNLDGEKYRPLISSTIENILQIDRHHRGALRLQQRESFTFRD